MKERITDLETLIPQLATKADLTEAVGSVREELRAEMRAEIGQLRTEMNEKFSKHELILATLSEKVKALAKDVQALSQDMQTLAKNVQVLAADLRVLQSQVKMLMWILPLIAAILLATVGANVALVLQFQSLLGQQG